MNHLQELNLRLHSLVIFRNLLNDPVLSALLPLLVSDSAPPLQQAERYAAFVQRLFEKTENLTGYIRELMLSDDNFYIRKYTRENTISHALSHQLQNELRTLEAVAGLQSKDVLGELFYRSLLPAWQTEHADFRTLYDHHLSRIKLDGYGVFYKRPMLYLKDGEIAAVDSHDTVSLSDLKGYKEERQAVLQNTLALLQDKPAANVLLYGDAGTGKSSTVKAIVNAYACQGLRLVEISKHQLSQLPSVMQALSLNPLKFILFIDDLSFAQDNLEYGALKAVLEGSVCAKARNIAVYVTSNRRHLVKELFSDRGDDLVQVNETIQEQTSLADRFGLAVGFYKPDKARYLHIVRELALQHGVAMAQSELELQAERYALMRGGRSPRIALQFIEQLLASGS